MKKPLIIAGSLLLLMSSAGTSFAAYSHLLQDTYWPQGRSSVTYSIQSTFDATTKSQMQTGIAQWNNALPSGSFLYKSASDTNDTLPSANNINTITKYAYGASEFTAEHLPYVNSSNKVIESDIRVNSSQNWSNSPKPNYRDIQSTMTHEFGHSLRVGHSPVYEDTMFDQGSMNTDYKRTLTTADREAAQEVIVFLTGNKGSRPDKDDFGYYLIGQAQGKFDSGVQSQSQGVVKNSTDPHSLDLNNMQNEINRIEKYNKVNNIPRLHLPEGQESNI